MAYLLYARFYKKIRVLIKRYDNFLRNIGFPLKCKQEKNDPRFRYRLVNKKSVPQFKATQRNEAIYLLIARVI